ncbi:hypothetical protein NIASO_05920 [Niabella soli DSM 19437]|uniref:Uncharacterized protein n=1 Tax=Niabella soli DSM 19437 TaxID=929713 RepID=W0F2V3_9BACT|nr:hypothetical protein NIASO_05920 [Niabella soli DSM 19437]
MPDNMGFIHPAKLHVSPVLSFKNTWYQIQIVIKTLGGLKKYPTPPILLSGFPIETQPLFMIDFG